MPILVDSVGGVECNVVGSVMHGDHTVFVGEVQSAYLNNDVDSLNLSSSQKVPFLLIWGEKDNFIPLFVGKKIANFHRWVKLKIVSNSGHCIHDEDPSVFNRISYEWIRDLKTF